MGTLDTLGTAVMVSVFLFIAAVALLAALVVGVSVVLLESNQRAGLADVHVDVSLALGARERLLDSGYLLRG